VISSAVWSSPRTFYLACWSADAAFQCDTFGNSEQLTTLHQPLDNCPCYFEPCWGPRGRFMVLQRTNRDVAFFDFRSRALMPNRADINMPGLHVALFMDWFFLPNGRTVTVFVDGRESFVVYGQFQISSPR
jgi:hypothetical protein